MTPATAPSGFDVPEGHMLDLLGLVIPRERYVAFRMKLLGLLDEYEVEKVADQSSGDNVTLATALDALTKAVSR